jgi:hypothetical protein
MEAFESIQFAFRVQHESDFGIDAHAELIEAMLPTGRLLGIQLKSGSSYFNEVDEKGYVFRTDREHVKYWCDHALPVIICLCDTQAKVIYWQPVNEETAISTGKGFKFSVPADQKVERASVRRLKDLLEPVVPADRYTIFRTEDVSHAGAKRYSIEAVLNGSATKAEVAAIVRKMTNDGARRRYYRSHLVKGRWGDSDAHVVWTFVYPSAEDFNRRNHICRSLWINTSLDPRFHPMRFDGEGVGDGIVVEWNPDYTFRARHVSEHTISKEAYFSQVLPLVDELDKTVGVLREQMDSLSSGVATEPRFVSRTQRLRNRTRKIYSVVSDLPFAPFECSAMDAKLELLVSYLDNFCLYYSKDGFANWDAESRLSESLRQLSYARRALDELHYELSKVR